MTNQFTIIAKTSIFPGVGNRIDQGATFTINKSLPNVTIEGMLSNPKGKEIVANQISSATGLYISPTLIHGGNFKIIK